MPKDIEGIVVKIAQTWIKQWSRKRKFTEAEVDTLLNFATFLDELMSDQLTPVK